MKLTNTSKRERGIPLADRLEVVPPGGEIEITEQDLARINRFVTSKTWLERGLITVSGEKVKKKADERVAPELPEGVTGTGIEYEMRGSWCHLWVNGERCTDKLVRKAQAEEMAKDYGG